MSVAHRTARIKPSKPYPEFPLFPHATGRWAKKIRGTFVYFGPWDDPDGALEKYLKEKDALHAGRKPREQVSTGVTVKEVCNRFLNAKLGLVKSGELTNRSWEDYKTACDLIVSFFRKDRLVADLDPEDFNSLRGKMARKWGPVTLGNAIQRVRTVFKFAAENGLIERPVCYGQEFKRPKQKVLRINRARRGPKLFTADDIRRLADAAAPTVRAMILLGINCGFGNADCGTLPLSAVDLDAAVIDFPRPKNGIARRCPLWPETVQAIRAALADRPAPKSKANAGLVFITKYGLPWAKDIPDSPVAKELKKLVQRLGLKIRKGIGFYTLRHTFRTVADEAKDQPAADFIMGHESTHMSSHYRETISDARLKAVTDYVRGWLFAEAASESPAA
jgi:integrase